eukprot:m.457020 g.457020  ORF g.457020 m.457020 type:complete len:210 (+) comp56981_c2_seq2:1636-2265(+)
MSELEFDFHFGEDPALLPLLDADLLPLVESGLFEPWAPSFDHTPPSLPLAPPMRSLPQPWPSFPAALVPEVGALSASYVESVSSHSAASSVDSAFSARFSTNALFWPSDSDLPLPRTSARPMPPRRQSETRAVLTSSSEFAVARHRSEPGSLDLAHSEIFTTSPAESGVSGSSSQCSGMPQTRMHESRARKNSTYDSSLLNFLGVSLLS